MLVGAFSMLLAGVIMLVIAAMGGMKKNNPL